MKQILSFILLVMLIVSCKEASNEGAKVKIETPYGEMVVLLYDETPQHRDNFLKLAGEGFYDDLLFHRIITEFMIQGGDPDSKDAAPDQNLGSGGPGYKIPAEFNRKFIHKKGALAAARQGDQSNPKRESSGSQFYIVQGKPFSTDELTKLEENKNQSLKGDIFQKLAKEYNDSISALQASGDQETFTKLRDFLIAETEKQFETVDDKFAYTEEQKQIYSTLGGTPHLDDAYTVFGEVIEGLNVIDSIAAQQANGSNRPLEDIKMKISVLK